MRSARTEDAEPLKARMAMLHGRPLSDIFGREVHQLLLEMSRRSARSGKTEELACLIRSSGGARCLRVTVRRAAGNGPSNMFAVLIEDIAPRGRIRKDVTEERHLESPLRKTEALLAQCEQLVNAGSWEYDVEKECFRWSPEFCRIIGYEPREETVPLQKAGELLPVGERERAWKDLEKLINGEHSMENEVSVTGGDGNTRILHSRATGVVGAAGQIVRVWGVSRDVTKRKTDEERRIKTEALLAQAEQFGKLGSWELDVRTGPGSESGQVFRFLGLDEAQKSGQQLYWENLHASDRIRMQEVLGEAVHCCKEFEYVGRYHIPGGGWRVFRTHGVPVRGADGKTARMMGVLQDITEQTRVEEELHRLSQRLMRARDEERRNTARELHETAGQSLAALKMTLRNLRDALPKRKSSTISLCQECADLADEAAREVRTVSYLMHPPMLDEAGLGSAIRWYAKGFSERSRIQTEVHIPDDFGRMPHETEMTLFRVVQEALTNIHRYSGSKVATIRLARRGGHIRLEVEDHGCGLARPIAPNGHEEVGSASRGCANAYSN